MYSKNIVSLRQSNGHINIYSERDVGTTVKLYLPCTQNGQTAEADDGASDAVRRGSERVGVIDMDCFVTKS